MRPAVLLAAALLAVSCSPRKPGDGSQGSADAKRLSSGSARWTNSLGMVFVGAAASSLRCCVWETRVQDFEAFVQSAGYDTGTEMWALRKDGWERRGGCNWRNPGFPQGPTHPVVGVSFRDAEAFCAWLTKRERAAGGLAPGARYALPTVEEWDDLAGQGRYPWGEAWPAPAGTGNLGGDEARDADWPPEFSTMPGYRDAYPRTAPVGSFTPNAAGLYDLAGNVWEWADNQSAGQQPFVMRGASWYFGKQEYYALTRILDAPPDYRTACIGFRVVLLKD